MSISEDGYFVCDICGDDTGRFDHVTGNHRPCIELAALRARVEASISPEELAHALGIEYDNAKSSAFYLMMVKQYRFHYEAGKKA